jgi:cytochrome c oxidase subunit I+III
LATTTNTPLAEHRADDREEVLLHDTWKEPPGFWGWFMHVNHRSYGRRFIVTGLVFFLLGGILAVLMRLQLSRPDNQILSADKYNQIFTMHGATMMFLFAVPIMEAVGIYIIPLIVGARNIAFPRLNAYGYWVYLLGGIFLWAAFLLNVGPDVGWFAYVPLSGPDYSPGKRADVWAQMITFTELAAMVVSIEIIVTIFKLRRPGMSLNRMPMICWSQLTTGFMVLFAMPSVMLASTLLILDRLVGTHFYNPAEGGDALLYQHLFWFFGHPEVYLIFLPATGMISAMLPTFTRRHLFAYPALVLATVGTGFVGFGVWVHHMFATGLPQMGASFFSAATLMIVIPTAIQIFCWMVNIWTGKLVWRTPFYWIVGFFVTFIIGGMTGVMQASVPIDLELHDSFFVVAHFHYVLLGGSVFPLFGALYYWFPKMTGRMMSETLGKLQFWLFFVGFHLTFFPMHFLGFRGMPRRIYTYPAEAGWGGINALASGGAVLLVLGGLVFLYNFIASWRSGPLAGDNPWDAGTLEWGTSSPPPSYNFKELVTVTSREPLWDDPPDQPLITGVRADIREVLVTGVNDAEPEYKAKFPEPSIWPFLAALATGGMFVASIFTAWALPIGLIPIAITLIGWFWPKQDEVETEELVA